MAELRPFITEPASALTPEAEFGGMLHGHRRDGAHTMENPLRLIEQPWHIHAINYIAMGYPYGQVATLCEVDPNTISLLMKTPWFQQKVTTALNEGGKDLMAVVNAKALSAFDVLVTIMEDPKAAPTVRSANAKTILEWKLGKAVQRMEVEQKVVSEDPVTEARQLEKEAEVLRKQLKAGAN